MQKKVVSWCCTGALALVLAWLAQVHPSGRAESKGRSLVAMVEAAVAVMVMVMVMVLL
jgi:hypothetical protein